MKYEQYSYEWLNGYGNSRLKPTTIKGYNHYLRNYINPYIGSYELSELTTYQIQTWVYELHTKGRMKREGKLNAKTVIQAYRIVSRSLKSATRVHLIDQNPCFGVELPRKRKCSYVWLSDGQDIQAFVAAFAGHWLYLPVLLALSLGLRRSELLGLRWSDFDFEHRTVRIDRSIVRGRDNRVVVDDLKNDSSHRTILLPENLLAVLAQIRSSEGANDAYLFSHADGQPLNPSSFSSSYCSYRKAHGLPAVRFHDLRHSHASYLYSQGVEPRIIQDRLGHSTIKTTLDIYVHSDYKIQAGAVELIDRLFPGC